MARLPFQPAAAASARAAFLPRRRPAALPIFRRLSFYSKAGRPAGRPALLPALFRYAAAPSALLAEGGGGAAHSLLEELGEVVHVRHPHRGGDLADGQATVAHQQLLRPLNPLAGDVAGDAGAHLPVELVGEISGVDAHRLRQERQGEVGIVQVEWMHLMAARMLGV